MKSNERFMRHHYGASGYVEPLTPWGEQIARVQLMCTEGFCNISTEDKACIRELLHRFLDLSAAYDAMKSEAAETMETVSRVMAKTLTSLHCDAGDHDKCFWTGQPDSAYPERIDKRCQCACHRKLT